MMLGVTEVQFENVRRDASRFSKEAGREWYDPAMIRGMMKSEACLSPQCERSCSAVIAEKAQFFRDIDGLHSPNGLLPESDPPVVMPALEIGEWNFTLLL